MRSLLIVLCVSCVGCYTIGNTPTARADAHRLAIVELVGAGLLLTAGGIAEHDYDANPDAVPPDNAAPLILITAGILTGLAGLIGWGNT